MTKILICDSDENPLKTGNNDNIKVNKVILNPTSTVGDLRRFLARTYGDEGFNTYSLRYYICLPTGDPRAEKVNSYFDTIPDNETPLANLVLEEKEKIRQNFVFAKRPPDIVIAITDPRFKPKKTATAQADATPQTTSSATTIQPTASSAIPQATASSPTSTSTQTKAPVATPEKTQEQKSYEQYKGKRFAELPVELQESIKKKDSITNWLITKDEFLHGLEAFWNAENYGNKGSREVNDEDSLLSSSSPLLLKEIKACPALVASTEQPQSASSSRTYSR